MPNAKVHRISANAPDDVSGIEQAIADKRMDPAGIVAIFGKTEGNGLVNDFSRGFATQSLGMMIERHLPRARAAEVCLVMSGGTEGAMAPHFVVFERGDGGGGRAPALALGRAHTGDVAAEHLGRLAHVEAVAAGVRAAMRDAAIADA
ncbi:MAG: cyanuric acid amidohydrolase, partial [Bradyrhizobiaceae bacterium]|nr:cyanuric acid amidohydrolase [Bradyrhizobiaceae bacterium]